MSGRVFHFNWSRANNLSKNKAVSFEAPKVLGKHFLRNTVNIFFNSLNRFGAFSRHSRIIIVHLPLIREKISLEGQACIKIFGSSFSILLVVLVTFRYLVYNTHP